MRYHKDDRRTFWGDIFELPNGDINVVHLYPKTTIAWHRHQFQDDRICVIRGDLTLQAIDPEGIRHSWILDADAFDLAMAGVQPPVVIPRGWWHGYSSRWGAAILSFNGPGKWTGEDEERHPIDDEMPWTIK